MEKRFFLALVLSFAVLAVFSPKQKNTEHIVNKGNTDIQSSVIETNPLPQSVSDPLVLNENIALSNLKPLESTELKKIRLNGLELSFSTKGAYISKVVDMEKEIEIPFTNIGFVPMWKTIDFDMSEIPRGVVFSHLFEDGSEVRKTYRIKTKNILELQIDVINSKILSYEIFSGSFNAGNKKDQMNDRYKEGFVYDGAMMQRKAVHSLKKEMEYGGGFRFAGLRDRYFCVVLLSQTVVDKTFMEKLDLGKGVAGGESVYFKFEPSYASGVAGRSEDVFDYYIGPQNEAFLKGFAEGADKVVNFGTFDSISKGILFFLKLGHKLTGSWGFAIIFVTMFIYGCLFPLSYKSMVSMKRMQALQPKVEEMRAKHKDSPQKLNVEIMELYKKEKVNPFGGCLPMIVQIPVFFALYQLLMKYIELKGASFLWIKDLSEPDRLFIFAKDLPFIGNELNILPLLMAVMMFFQQKIVAPQAVQGSQSAEQQKIMGIMMPVIFGFLFYKMPAGLVLYWFVNSMLMFLFQWKISKKT